MGKWKVFAESNTLTLEKLPELLTLSYSWIYKALGTLQIRCILLFYKYQDFNLILFSHKEGEWYTT
jgi:hypothetical protein